MDKVVNILLVEDDNLDIIDVKRTLDKMHILNNMTVARNGEDALQILNNKKRSAETNPDIVLIAALALFNYPYFRKLQTAVSSRRI